MFANKCDDLNRRLNSNLLELKPTENLKRFGLFKLTNRIGHYHRIMKLSVSVKRSLLSWHKCLSTVSDEDSFKMYKIFVDEQNIFIDQMFSKFGTEY